MTTHGRIEHPRRYFQRGTYLFDLAYEHHLSMSIHAPDDAQISPMQRVPRIYYSPTSGFMGLSSLGCTTNSDRTAVLRTEHPWSSRRV